MNELFSPLLAFSAPGGPELLAILFIVLLLFGAKKLPELARGLGSSVREFKKARDDFDSELRRASDDMSVETPAGRQPYAGAPNSPKLGAGGQGAQGSQPATNSHAAPTTHTTPVG